MSAPSISAQSILTRSDTCIAVTVYGIAHVCLYEDESPWSSQSGLNMFDTNSLQVLSAPPDGFEYSVDILIIGAGACGLTAALAAAEQGVDTHFGARCDTLGSTAMSYGAICAAGSGPKLPLVLLILPRRWSRT